MMDSHCPSPSFRAILKRLEGSLAMAAERVKVASLRVAENGKSRVLSGSAELYRKPDGSSSAS